MDEIPRPGRWQQFLAFHRSFLAHPGRALILSVLADAAGLAFVLDWTGHSTVRPHWRVEHWMIASLWWLLGAYFAFVAINGYVARRR